MKTKYRACCIALLLLVQLPERTAAQSTAKVEGVVVDITDARIAKATLTFGDGTREYWTKTRWDGTYTIELKPGTYTMKVGSYGFCTLRRSAFVLQKHTTVQFNLQMWVCPTDMVFVQYAELAEVHHTHLRPLVLYAKEEQQGELRQFRGPNTNNDGTGRPRQYPAVFTFNLLTIRAEELVYDPANHTLTAIGNVFWQDENRSGSDPKVVIKLEGSRPKLVRYAMLD
jgi:hypothetical protein